MNCELPDVQAGLEKAEELEISCQHPLDHCKSKRVPENLYFCFIEYAKACDCVPVTCFLGNMYAGQEATVTTRHEQQTGSKLGKEYVKDVYCQLACLTYMQSIPCEKPGCMKHKLESRLLGEISITSDT